MGEACEHVAMVSTKMICRRQKPCRRRDHQWPQFSSHRRARNRLAGIVPSGATRATGRKRRLAILTGHDVNVHGTDDAPTATAGKRPSSISRHSDTMVRAQL